MRTLLSDPKLLQPRCDLQTELPQDLHVSAFLLQAQRLLQRGTDEHLCSEVRGSRSDVCGPRSGSDLCGACPDVCSCSGSDLCGSGSRSRSDVCGACSDLCGSGSEVRTAGPGSRPGQVLRRARCGEVLRHGLREELLQSRSVRSGSLDL